MASLGGVLLRETIEAATPEAAALEWAKRYDLRAWRELARSERPVIVTLKEGAATYEATLTGEMIPKYTVHSIRTVGQ